MLFRSLYYDLIAEEFAELNAAVLSGDRKEQLDALLDIMVVTAGAIHSMGADGEGGWKEVMSTKLVTPTTSMPSSSRALASARTPNPLAFSDRKSSSMMTMGKRNFMVEVPVWRRYPP